MIPRAGATFLDEQGASRPIVLGCYGLAIDRLLACIIQAHRDGKDIRVVATEVRPRNQGLLTMIPSGARLRSVVVRGGIAYIDLSESFRFTTLGREGLNAQLEQVVFANVLVVNGSVPATTLDEFVAHLKKNPGRLKVAEEMVARGAAEVDSGEAAIGQLEHDRDSLAAARERRA